MALQQSGGLSNWTRAYGLFSAEGLEKAMDSRIKQLWQQRNRLVTIHVHAPKAGGTALAYALASSCNCTNKFLLAKDSANVCTDCRRVLIRHRSLPGWIRFPCTFSRVTGWPCSVAHAPLALLRLLPECTPEHTIEMRGKPLFVIMLRDPWQRFVSEWKSWGGYRLNTLDWSAVALPHENVTFPFHNKSQVAFHPAVVRRERALLEDLVSLPAEFILHNRYTKMIGGVASDFDFTFNRTKIGSRWVGGAGDAPLVSPGKGNGSYPGTMRLQHDRALQSMQRTPNVLPLLQERFAESLCILEVILGGMQKFTWAAKNHSHGALLGAYHGPDPGPLLGGRGRSLAGSRDKTQAKKKQREYTAEDYPQWSAKNADDLLLYDHAVKIFHVQLRSALRFLGNRLAVRGPSILPQIQRQQPHCVELEEWKATLARSTAT